MTSHRDPTASMVAFTICSRNYLAYALALHRSLTRHHPDVTFYLALCDGHSGLDLDSFPFRILRLEELGLPDLEGMAARYSVTEFNTAIKPFVFQLIFDLHPLSPVLYLDPDIHVTAPFEELYDLLADGAECVLTPAITEPAEHAEYDDQQFLRFGAYNLGFCCLVGSTHVRRIVWWWARRLSDSCVVDLEAGLFVDQKWVDLFPAFIEETRLLRHPGYNVAYWNIPQRRIRKHDDSFQVNGLPLRFMHFSGSVIDDESLFSRHSALLDIRNVGPAADLLADFRDLVRRCGHASYSVIPYEFSWSGESGHDPPTPSHDALTAPTKGAGTHLPVMAWRTRDSYDAWARRSESIIAARHAAETNDVPGHFAFELSGYCIVCDEERQFLANDWWTDGPASPSHPNWRELLGCRACRFRNRQRAAYQILLQEVRPHSDARIYMTERVTDYYDLIASQYPETIGSEYFGPGRRSGEIVDGIRHEDVQSLSFGSEEFDVILSLEVVEHVHDEMRAFREFARCLRPGGTMLMSTPTSLHRDSNEVRAVLRSNGEIEHLLAPEYHGNPLDPEGGSLAFRSFGWQILEQLREAGFNDAYILTYWSKQLMYYGEPQLVIVGVK